jgi:hypothetical protein
MLIYESEEAFWHQRGREKWLLHFFFMELLMVRKGGEPCSLHRMDLIKFKVLLIY